MSIEPDLLRHAAKGFAVAVVIAALFGFLFTTLGQVPTEQIEYERERGYRIGEQRGYAVAFNQGQRQGAEQAEVDWPRLQTAGNPDDAYRMAYDFAWNSAIEYALDTARPRKLQALAAFDEWESLLR